MRARYFVAIALFLTVCSVFLVHKVFGEDYGPFDMWINFHSSEVLDPKQLGMKSREDFAGHTVTNGIGHCVYDVPYWPSGDPGAGSEDALPPLITRHTIHAIRPRIPFLVLTMAWACWGTLLIVRLARQRESRCRGFEVSGTLPRSTEEGVRGPAAESKPLAAAPPPREA